MDTQRRAREMLFGSAVLEWVWDRCRVRPLWRWAIDSNTVSDFESISAELWYHCFIFNINSQLISATNSTNLSHLSLSTEMLSKPESEENSFKELSLGKKLGKGEWNPWERRFRIEIAEFDEVAREIETGVEADFETEDMEEMVLADAITDRDGNVITPPTMEMRPKKKYAGPTGLAKWTSLYCRNKD